MTAVHDHTITFPDGSTKPLSEWADAPVLLVNVASKCGFTPQYEGLEKLHQDGLAIIGFPCNQFGGQEPGTDAEIAEFCSTTYQVSFPITTKIEVNGPGADPLWAYLRSRDAGDFGPDGGMLYQHLAAAAPEKIGTDEIKWNFTKFLVRPDGSITRYETYVTPDKIAADLAGA